jgi:hypothetical protein
MCVGGSDIGRHLLRYDMLYFTLIFSPSFFFLAGEGQVGSDTYFNSHSAMCARLATGTVLDVCRRVMRKEVLSLLALLVQQYKY